MSDPKTPNERFKLLAPQGRSQFKAEIIQIHPACAILSKVSLV